MVKTEEINYEHILNLSVNSRKKATWHKFRFQEERIILNFE